MAPEVLKHLIVGDVDTHHAVYTEKADIYSAALVMWYLLTGLRPSCSARHDPHERPDAAAAHRRWGELAKLLERMWDHDPAARPAAAECAAAVRAMPAGCAPGAGCAVQ